MKEDNKIRDEINAHLSDFNSFLEMWGFGFTDLDDGFPLNFENIVETLNNVKEIISEAFEVYNELNKLLEKEIKKAQKQEKLLNQIKDIINRPDDEIVVALSNIHELMLEESKRYAEIEKLIKEEENDNT